MRVTLQFAKFDFLQSCFGHGLKMSTERRKISADEVADKRHSASPRKKLRLSSVIEVDSKGQRVKPDAIGVGTYKPTCAP